MVRHSPNESHIASNGAMNMDTRSHALYTLWTVVVEDIPSESLTLCISTKIMYKMNGIINTQNPQGKEYWDSVNGGIT